jgi:hypothetical protein
MGATVMRALCTLERKWTLMCLLWGRIFCVFEILSAALLLSHYNPVNYPWTFDHLRFFCYSCSSSVLSLDLLRSLLTTFLFGELMICTDISLLLSLSGSMTFGFTFPGSSSWKNALKANWSHFWDFGLRNSSSPSELDVRDLPCYL